MGDFEGDWALGQGLKLACVFLCKPFNHIFHFPKTEFVGFLRGHHLEHDKKGLKVWKMERRTGQGLRAYGHTMAEATILHIFHHIFTISPRYFPNIVQHISTIFPQYCSTYLHDISTIFVQCPPYFP